MESKKRNANQRAMILEFVKDEYPNFALKNDDLAINKLCIATLILSKLSVEPMFHEMLCSNIDEDIQIKIRSILEIVYALDKNIDEQDFYNVFANKKDRKLFYKNTKFISDKFVDHSVIDDDMPSKQFQEMRKLKVQIETMEYENSDLIDDNAAKDKEIKELQKKLQETKSELKILRADSFKFNSSLAKLKVNTDLGSTYQKELKRLEKYINDLQIENNQLQDEKKALSTEVKELYIKKCQDLKERNENKKKEIKSAMLNKSQEKQINDLQTKLLAAMEAKDRNASDIGHLNKLESLEKSVQILKSKNYTLKQENFKLIEDARMYKDMHYILKEKNDRNEKTIESMQYNSMVQEKQIKDLKYKLNGVLFKTKDSKVNTNNNTNTQKKNTKSAKVSINKESNTNNKTNTEKKKC